jgi:hypothetical protein
MNLQLQCLAEYDNDLVAVTVLFLLINGIDV